MPEFELEIRGSVERVRVEPGEAGTYRVTIGDRTHDVAARRISANVLSMFIEGRSVLARVAREGDRRFVALDGHAYTVTPPAAKSSGGSGAAAGGDGKVTTPMPGKVVTVKVSAGDRVAEGDTLVIVEAMKMEHDLRAPFDGVVSAVHCVDAAAVQFGDVLVEVEPSDES